MTHTYKVHMAGKLASYSACGFQWVHLTGESSEITCTKCLAAVDKWARAAYGGKASK